MKIILNNVIPNPLKEDNLELSKVWNTSLHITNDDHYFLSSNSGKGKSTFLNYLYGLRNDYEGSILINDEDISKFSLQDWSNLRKEKIAYLPQNLQLINHLSVWDNLLLKNNLTNRYSEGQIKAFLTQFNLLTHINRPVEKLSIGQQQRVALIRTLLQPFNILLLDEPFSHLDEENIIIGLDLINEACKKENANYIIATLGYSYGIESNKTLLL
jgi:ABC-type lipoprotein export system ATPase subunit